MSDQQTSKRPYHPPKVVHSEKITTHAVSCAKSDDNSCFQGPIYS